MKTANWLMGFALGLLSVSAFGQSSCPTPVVEISKIIPEPQVNRALDFKGLRAHSERLDKRPASGGAMAGLYEPQSQLGVNFETKAISGFEHCLTKLSLTLQQAPLIRIASEIPEASCAGREALAHELQHHEAFARDGIAAVVKSIHQDPPAPGVLLGATESQARQSAIGWLRGYAQRLNDALEAGALDGARDLDSPQSYARLGALCQAEGSLSAMAGLAAESKGRP